MYRHLLDNTYIKNIHIGRDGCIKEHTLVSESHTVSLFLFSALSVCLLNSNSKIKINL